MKTSIINRFPRHGATWACLGGASTRGMVLSALIAGLGFTPVGPATAQTFRTLYSFTGGNDGAVPNAGLFLSGNTLYGTTIYGGTSFDLSGNGTVFAINTDGSDFTNLHSFTARTPPWGPNSDGAYPEARLILSGDALFGTTTQGGNGGVGTAFAVNTDSTGFTNLHTFTGGNDGARPYAALIISGTTLYGTAPQGGSSGSGTVFAVNTDGSGFTNLYTFTAATDDGNGNYINSDGASPYAGLVLSGTTLYGTAHGGGSSGRGTVFAVNINGSGFTNLYSFTGDDDGYFPQAGLVLSSNTLYGTVSSGGSLGGGTVFAVNTDGSSFTTLHSLGGSDGSSPRGNLVLSGNTLYGTAVTGGMKGHGTVFAVNTDGSGFTTLYSFTDGDDGPNDGLILSGNTLYGTTESGGTNGHGTLFSLSFEPQLAIFPSAASVVLTWPTNVAGFDYSGFALQATPNLADDNSWTPVLTVPVIEGSQSRVIDPISGPAKFYRLKK